MSKRFTVFAMVCALALLGAQGKAFADASVSVKQRNEIKLGTPNDLSKQYHLIEIGSFGGVFMPDTGDHQFHDPSIPQRSLEDCSLDLGARIAYLPIPYLGIEAELAYMPTTTTDGMAVQLLGVRGHLLAQYPARLAPFLVVGMGGMGVNSRKSAQGNDDDGLFHWGVGLKFYATRWLQVRFDFRHLLGPGEDTKNEDYASHFEVLAGLSFVIGWKSRPGDRDGDGLTDDKDKCPDVPAKTPDGCPIPDTDGDGLLDDVDKCPKVPAKTPDGCPILDSDGDGVFDDTDKCPTVPAKTPDGCPIPDTDGDGILDNADKCINDPETKNGYQDEDGCPDEVPVEVKEYTGVLPGITFDVDTAKIRKSSYPTLDAAVKVLTDYPSLKVVIRGHTDNSGTREWNLDLSKRRADAVREYVVGKGVAADRLRTEGLGFDEPVADNNTEDGRAQNRRIEFKIEVKK